MSLVKNSGIVVVGTIVANIISYIFHFFAARMLGPDEYGKLGTLLAFFALLCIPLGAIYTGITKFTAFLNSNGESQKIFVLKNKIQKHILILIGFIILFLIIFSKNFSSIINVNSKSSFLILGVVLIFNFLYYINLSMISGLKKFKELSFISIFEALSRLFFFIILFYSGIGFLGGIVSFGLSYLLSYYLLIKKVKQNIVSCVTITKTDFLKFYKFILKSLFVSILLQFLLNLPSIIVNHYYNNTFTGYWIAALNVAKIPLLVSTAIAQVMFTELSSIKNKIDRKSILLKSVLMVLITNVLFTILFFLKSNLIIGIIYGSQFNKASQFLGLMGIFMTLYSLLNVYLNNYLSRNTIKLI